MSETPAAAPAVPPAPAPSGRATTTQDIKGRPAPPAPQAKTTPSNANEAKFGRKTPAVRVTYLGPQEPVVTVGNPPMRWQKGVQTRETREFWDAAEGLQFDGLKFGDLAPPIYKEDDPRNLRPAFKVERLP
ncbi:MAG: hypothetical protein ABR586_09395 [Thermoplasmatota archaeon]